MTQLVWLVTGCSSGFGAQFIKTIVKRGHLAIATACNIDTLKDAVELGAETLLLDVTASPSELNAKVKEAIEFYGRIDVLVQNAGYCQLGPVELLPYQKMVTQFETNTFAILNLIQSIMPHWRGQQIGYHVLISSQSAWKTALPTGVYAASKAAANRLAADLHTEVTVLTGATFLKSLILDPGNFNTDVMAPNKPTRDMSKDPKHYEQAMNHIGALLETAQDNIDLMLGSPEKFAEIMVDIVSEEGVAKGRLDPADGGYLELPMGKDAYERLKTECDRMLKNLEVWEDVIKSTDTDRLPSN